MVFPSAKKSGASLLQAENTAAPVNISERSNKRKKLDFLLENGRHRSTKMWYCRLYHIIMLQHLDVWNSPYESAPKKLIYVTTQFILLYIFLQYMAIVMSIFHAYCFNFYFEMIIFTFQSIFSQVFNHNHSNFRKIIQKSFLLNLSIKSLNRLCHKAYLTLRQPIK